MTGMEYGLTAALSLLLVALALAVSRRLYDKQEEKRQGRTKAAIKHHVSRLVDILEDVYSRVKRADHGDMEARAADTYFAKSVRRLDASRLCAEMLLSGLDHDDKYAVGVRRILDAVSWVQDRYRDPTLDDGGRLRLWRSGRNDLHDVVYDAVRTAQSLGIVPTVVINGKAQ